MTALVSPSEVKRLLRGVDPIAILDVREHGQYGEGHLLFASNCPYSLLEPKVCDLVPDLSAHVIVYDNDDGVAERAAARLSGLGYSHVSVLEGGADAWTAAGYVLFKGVNVPSKVLGELVELANHTPVMTAEEFDARRSSGEKILLVDGRPTSEYVKMTVPGATSLPNGELLYRYDALDLPDTVAIVVHCAGRTRGLIGAQSLINAGVKNPVWALENGTQGWALSGRKLLRGTVAETVPSLSEAQISEGKALALSLAQKFGVKIIGAADLVDWQRANDCVAYVLDVRTKQEFDAGHVSGARHAPAVQLVQASDEWVAIRRARIALVDDNCLRAVSAAIWLSQLGHSVVVVENAMSLVDESQRKSVFARHAVEPLTPIMISELSRGNSKTMIVDVRASQNFRKCHIAGSNWAIRPRIKQLAQGAHDRFVFVADDVEVAALAAQDLREESNAEMFLLDGGIEAWKAEGLPVEEDGKLPEAHDAIDFLYFVHDRHAGNMEASRLYLAWETGLVGMLDADERDAFSIMPVEH